MARNKKIVPVDKSRIFDVKEYLFSITDHAGVIKACNDVFCRISGYEPQEVLGSPHNIVRHPDIPRALFERVWDYLQSGRPAGAYINNLAKTGEYYWVFAVIVPVESGFLSIRLKPTSELLPAVQALYARARDLENSYTGDRKEGMRLAGELIDTGIREAGFESYEDFMVQALNREVECRLAAIDDQVNSAALLRQTREVKRLFEMRQSLNKISDFFDGLAVKIRRVAINASIVAARLEEKGSALGVISEEVSNVAARLTEETSQLRDQVEDLRQQLFATSFNASFRSLLNETQLDFERSMGKSTQSIDEQRMSFGSGINEICTILDKRHAEAKKTHKKNSEGLQRSLKRFDRFIDALSRILMTLQFGYVTGKSVSVAIDGGQEFSVLLEDLAGYYSEAQTELKRTRDKVRGLPGTEPAASKLVKVNAPIAANSGEQEAVTRSAA